MIPPKPQRPAPVARDGLQSLVERARALDAASAEPAPPPATNVQLPAAAALDGPDGLEWLALLDAAAERARDGPARTTLTAELLLQPGPDDEPGVPIREHLLAIAERNGWKLMLREDVGAGLLQQRQSLLQLVGRQRAALAREGVDPTAALRRLTASVAGLRDGRRVGERWELQQSSRPLQRLLAVTGTHSVAMRALFADVFGHDMSAEHWHWKYGRGPGRALALFENGDMVAHYGGLTRDLRVLGQPLRGCQVCDVMVAPRARRSLARRGPMYRIAATFLETQIGWALPHAVGYGFPSARHQGAADRMKLYEAVDRLVQLSWPASAADPPPPVVLQELGRPGRCLTAGDRRRVDRLWQAMARSMTDVALGVRDADWLQWRYLERPGVDYEVLLVRSRWWRRPLGVVVLRRRDDVLELMDLVAPPEHFALLLAAARARAAQAGRAQLRCWVTASQQMRLAPVLGTPHVQDLGIEVPACCHTAGPAPALLRGRWFLLGGDADFT